ncbi:MAG: hypothetical protein R3F61_00480 [Myxococcota bacterium]
MDLPHDPRNGVSRSDDLSGTALTLTRRRGGDLVAGLFAGAAVIAAAVLTGWDVHLIGWPLLMLGGAVQNQFKTHVSLGARALTVERLALGQQREHVSVPYEALTAVEVAPGRLGGSTLLLHRVGAETIAIHHGTPSDHEALRLAIDARRPIQRVPTEAELREPAALRALRSKQAT